MPSPHVQVTVDGVTESAIRTVAVTEQNYRHTIAVIDVVYRNSTVSSTSSQPKRLFWREGSPLQVDHGWTTSFGTFYGYVVGHQILPQDPESRDDGTHVRYLAQGTAYPMQTAQSRAWGDSTASYLARTIAAEYGLRPLVDTHPWVLGYRAQNGISDFRFLVERAKEVGYDFSVNGPYLLFRDPVRALNNAAANSLPTFTMNRDTGRYDTLTVFTPVVGELLAAGGVAATRTSTVLTANRNVLTATSGSSPITIQSHRLARSFSEAEQVVKAETLANIKWAMAEAQTAGDSRLHVGAVLGVDGKAVPDAYKGLWSVDAVTHSYDLDPSTPSNTYLCELEIRRDKQRRIEDVPRNNHNPVEIPPQMTTLDGRWRVSRN